MIKQRLLDICSALDISASEFCLSIGKSRSYIANIKKEISTDILLNIYIKYPSVNLMRIITGEGEILLEDNTDGDNIPLSYAINKCHQLEMENKELTKEIKELLLEVGELKGRIKEIKKRVPEEGSATCADASGSDLEK